MIKGFWYFFILLIFSTVFWNLFYLYACTFSATTSTSIRELKEKPIVVKPHVNPNIIITTSHTLFSQYQIPATLGCQSIFKPSGLTANDPADFKCLTEVQATSQVITRQVKEELYIYKTRQNGHNNQETDPRAEMPRPKIALLQPITTSNLPDHERMKKISDLLPISTWLCSFLQTVEPDKFQYRIYYGYDAGDP